MNVLLVGPRGHGGEDVYVNGLLRHPPPGIQYLPAGDFHKGAPGATCTAVSEILLNRCVYPFTIPDIGFRAFRLSKRFDLVHLHAHPTRLTGKTGQPVVMSEGSSPIVYVQEYLGWDRERLQTVVTRSRRLYRLFGIRDRLLALDRVRKAYVFSAWAREVQIEWGADPDKLEVLYPGFHIPELPKQRRRADVFRLLFVGRDFERKGGFEVVEAFDALLKRFPDAHLTVAGSNPAERNPDRYIHSWIDDRRRERALNRLTDLTRDGRAEIRPWVDREELMREIYPCADAFVMPPHAEGFGFTNVEAMSFGLPVITSTVGPAEEIVTPGETGLVVPPGDVAQLSEAMLQLAENPEQTSSMGARARESFLARFTVERFRSALGDFYRRALES